MGSTLYCTVQLRSAWHSFIIMVLSLPLCLEYVSMTMVAKDKPGKARGRGQKLLEWRPVPVYWRGTQLTKEQAGD